MRRGRNARVGALPQLPVLPAGTVRAAVCDGLDRSRSGRAKRCFPASAWAACSTRRPTSCRAGRRSAVALAALLAREWDALILDEPTNHLDLDAIAYLEEWLAAFPGGLLLVTHDRHVLDRVTNKVLEIDRGATYLHVPHERTGGSGYAAYLAARIEREAQAATAEQTRKNLARARARVAAAGRAGAHVEAEGTHRRRQRPARARARGGGARGRARACRSAAPDWDRRVSSSTASASRGPAARDGGDAERCSSLKPFDYMLEPGDRVGIVGPNGAGKSTLLDLVAGRLQPTQGRSRSDARSRSATTTSSAATST